MTTQGHRPDASPGGLDGGPTGGPSGGTGPRLGVSSPATDRALARRAGLGDRAAYEELFRRHFGSSFRFALRMLDGDEGLAEDVVQEAWIKVWRNLPDFRGDSRFTTWVFTIVTRLAYDSRRRTRPVVVDHHLLEPVSSEEGAGVDLPRSTDGHDPARAAIADELWRSLALALAELPWRQRASWILRELEDMSYDEIASVLGTTTGVVRGQLHRARATLAIRMEQWR